MTLNRITSESAALWVDNPTNNSPSICFDYIFALLAEIGCPEIFPARKIAGSNFSLHPNQPPRTSSFNIFHCFKFEPTEKATVFVVSYDPTDRTTEKKHIFHKCEHSKHQLWVSIKYEQMRHGKHMNYCKYCLCYLWRKLFLLPCPLLRYHCKKKKT